MINGEGNPMTTPNFEVGDKMTVIALPSPEIWTTQKVWNASDLSTLDLMLNTNHLKNN